MKIDRLIGILSILLQKEMTTAPELANHFEVSRRTINRDIEALCKAGIPIQTAQGVGGGISIVSGYRLDRTVLTSRDMQVILAGLRSLDSVSGSKYYSQLMEKLQAGSSDIVSGKESILIDLSSWCKKTLAPKISVIQDAIEKRHLIKFKYFSPSGESRRTIEPYFIVFKWNDWYVYGWCRKRKDYRLFKLNRMDRLTESDGGFICRNAPVPSFSSDLHYPREIKVKALFDADMKWKLVEEFGAECNMESAGEKILFSADYADLESLMGWLLSFGDKVEVLEPAELRKRMKTIADSMSRSYRRKK